MLRRRWCIPAVAIALGAMAAATRPVGGKQYGFDREVVVDLFRRLSERMGVWTIPIYVLVHTLALALCLPYAVFFEAGASLLFGFFPAVLCVFSVKVLGASLSFWIGRLVFMNSSSANKWAQRNKYFHVLSEGVERDGWKFVLMARFSPVPSYVINYALAATKVRYFIDFLLPTVIGCLPMILQNTSLGSLAGAAVASTSGARKSQVRSYIFPMLGIMSSVFIYVRIRKYSKSISVIESSAEEEEEEEGISNSENGSCSSEALTDEKEGEKQKKIQ